MTLRLIWNTAHHHQLVFISIIYGCASSSFIYDYDDAGNVTFHIYGYGFKKKKKNCNGSKQSSLAGRALPSDSRHQYRACHCVLMFPASQAAQHLESQWAPSVTWPRPRLSRDSAPDASPAAAPGAAGSRGGPGWRSLPGSRRRAAALLAAVVRPQPGCSWAARRTGFFRVCRLAAFQGSWQRPVGRRVALHVCSDYHPQHNHRPIKQYAHAKWGNFPTSPYLFLNRETRKSESQIAIRNDWLIQTKNEQA